MTRPAGAGERWAVVGGGFRGIVAAKLLREAGCEVTLIERMGSLGGILHAEEWQGLYLDKGCHYFDNADDRVTRALLEILEDRVVPVTPRLATRLNGRISQGVALVDFSRQEADLRRRIAEELKQVAGEPDHGAGTLAAALMRRFGATAGAVASAAARKAFAIAPEALDASALWTSPFVRIRPDVDKASRSLKEIAGLDGRLAVSSLDDHFRFAPGVTGYRHRFFYPAGCGLRSFCDAAAAHLEGLGVDLVLGRGLAGLDADAHGVRLELQDGETLPADRLLWTLDLGPLAGLVLGEDPLSALIHRTPMVLFHFLLPAAAPPAFTYYYDFDPDSLVYRASAPGFYGRQSNAQGQSYLAVEVVVPQDHAVWRDPESAAPRVWSELCASGFTDVPAPLAVKITKTPVSFKNPRLGYGAALQKTLEHLVAAGQERISWSDPGLMKKNDILREVAALIGGGSSPRRLAG
ncbi:MAG: FAD-dependent oxidoreductase [Kiloniellales bacterium]|nr:FAD-dependent oxidoreductase [Kiloniellales bacterium]